MSQFCCHNLYDQTNSKSEHFSKEARLSSHVHGKIYHYFLCTEWIQTKVTASQCLFCKLSGQLKTNTETSIARLGFLILPTCVRIEMLMSPSLASSISLVSASYGRGLRKKTVNEDQILQSFSLNLF